MAEKMIGDREFRYVPRLALQALGLQFRLFQFIGTNADELPNLIANFGPRRADESAADFAAREARSNGAVFRMVSHVLTKNDSDKFTKLVDDILTKNEALHIKLDDGGFYAVDVDRDFTGHLGDLVQAVAFVVQEELSDFFGALRKSSKGAPKVPA